MFGVRDVSGTAYPIASSVTVYTRDYTLRYIIRLRTRLFSPSSPGESFILAVGASALPVLGVVVGPITIHVVNVDLARMGRLEVTAFAGALLEI